jgi:hypothetical protein
MLPKNVRLLLKVGLLSWKVSWDQRKLLIVYFGCRGARRLWCDRTSEDLETEQKVSYQIVGEDEADIKLSKVSITSPIARALIGKYSGDVVGVQAPAGVREYEILEVNYI